MATVEQTATLGDAFAATAAAHAGEPALRTARGERGPGASTPSAPRAAAAGLHGLGVGRGDTVALWLSNRPEFHVADTAAMQLGAAPFSIYSTFTVEQAEHVVGDAGSRVLVTEPAYLDRALAVRERRANRARADRPRRGRPHERAELGRAAGRRPGRLRRRRGRGRRSPRTTWRRSSTRRGRPVRRRASSSPTRNVVAQCAALGEALGLEARQRAISWLPMAHIAERLCTHYIPMHLGWTVTCLEDPRAIGVLLARRAPAVLLLAAAPVGEAARRDDRRSSASQPDGATALAALGLDEARVAAHRGGAVPGRGHRVLARARPAAVRGLRHVRDDRRGDGQRPRRRADRHRRPRAAGRRGRALGRGRGADARARRDARLPQPARRDRRGARRRRLDALRRRRRLRRRRLPADRRPDQGADHQRRRQEHVAREHRGHGQVAPAR